jgi:Sec-independent protein translocase protein TatA
LFGGIRPLLWLLVLSAIIALLVLGRRRADSVTSAKGKALKPESVKS